MDAPTPTVIDRLRRFVESHCDEPDGAAVVVKLGDVRATLELLDALPGIADDLDDLARSIEDRARYELPKRPAEVREWARRLRGET